MKKTKLLVISDDIRLHTGVGIQCNKLLTGLNKTGKYDIVEIAGSLVKQSQNPVMFNGIKLYPTSDGYGNAPLLRRVMDIEEPDILLLMSDLRFFEYVFALETEIRPETKVVLYHTWDNEPFPTYTFPWYRGCDKVVFISNFSYQLISPFVPNCAHIPHGFDPTEFYPLSAEQVAQQRERIIKQTGRDNIDFIVFWNNRNLNRKRSADVIKIFKEFYQTHPTSLLLLNTNAYDPEGPDLISVIDNVPPIGAQVMINNEKITSADLNVFYNIADVTVNISVVEGFGLCVGESLLATTPVIATKTGGMTEQMVNNNEEYGASLPPVVRSLYGNQDHPFIYQDFCSYEQVLSALTYAYEHPKEWKAKGEAGREFIINKFHTDTVNSQWDDLLQSVLTAPSTHISYEVIQV